MKEISQRLLSLIDEVELYHCKITHLENEKKEYEKTIFLLKQEKRKNLCQESKPSNTLSNDYKKLKTKEQYLLKLTTQLRDENAQMSVTINGLEEDNKKHTEILELLSNERNHTEDKRVHKEDESTRLKIKKLENEVETSKKYFAQIINLEERNEYLEQKYKEVVQDKKYKSAQHQTLHLQYLQMQRERNSANKNISNLEYEYESLNKLYQHLLKKNENQAVRQETIKKHSLHNESEIFLNSDIKSAKTHFFTNIDTLINEINPYKETKISSNVETVKKTCV